MRRMRGIRTRSPSSRPQKWSGTQDQSTPFGHHGQMERNKICMTLSPPREHPREVPDSSPGPQPHVPHLFQASSKVSIAEERGLDDPVGLTIYNGLQTGS